MKRRKGRDFSELDRSFDYQTARFPISKNQTVCCLQTGKELVSALSLVNYKGLHQGFLSAKTERSAAYRLRKN